MTPTGAEASTRYETEPLAALYDSGIPVVGLEIDRGDLLEYTGLIARLRGVSDEVADDFYREAKWQGQRPMYSHAWRSCPLELVDQGGSGQSWIGGFGAAPESPPLKTFTMRIEDLREVGANCVDVLRLQQQAYIESLQREG